MDKTLEKILNKATSSSYIESMIAIDQAYKHMKKKKYDIKTINFNALYNGDIVAVKLISRFSHDYIDNNERANFINTWTRAVYGTGNEVQDKLAHDKLKIKNTHLKQELEKNKRDFTGIRKKYNEEKEMHDHVLRSKDLEISSLRCEIESIKKALSSAESNIDIIKTEYSELKNNGKPGRNIYKLNKDAQYFSINSAQKKQVCTYINSDSNLKKLYKTLKDSGKTSENNYDEYVAFFDLALEQYKNDHKNIL